MKKFSSQDEQLISSETRIDYDKYNDKAKDPSPRKDKSKITDLSLLPNCTTMSDITCVTTRRSINS